VKEDDLFGRQDFSPLLLFLAELLWELFLRFRFQVNPGSFCVMNAFPESSHFDVKKEDPPLTPS